MTANVTRRHAHTKGQPRRTWAPLDHEFSRTLPVFPDVPNPLPPMQVRAVQDQFGLDLWTDTRAVHGVSDALVILAPHRTPAKKVARGVRELVEWVLRLTAVFAAVAVAPVLHGLGV